MARWIRTGIGMLILTGILVYGGIIPQLGKGLAADYPFLAYCYEPWLIFLELTALPCVVALVFGWSIAGEISRNQSFSEKNAKSLKWISWMAALDSAYFLAGNFILMLLDMNHMAVIMLSIFIVCVGIAVSLGTSALSHIVYKKSRGEAAVDLPRPIDFLEDTLPDHKPGKIVAGGDPQDQEHGGQEKNIIQ